MVSVEKLLNRAKFVPMRPSLVYMVIRGDAILLGVTGNQLFASPHVSVKSAWAGDITVRSNKAAINSIFFIYSPVSVPSVINVPGDD